MKLIIIIAIVVYSTLLYCYLHKKTHISLNYLYKDNLLNIVVSCSLILQIILQEWATPWLILLSIFVSIPAICILLTMLRFYRIPFRKTNMNSDGIVSPADGNIIYIKRIDSGVIPISVKNGRKATLNEFTNTGILDYPCWLIGINMTPFDVHKNCAPVSGNLILNEHFNGEFLSLKHDEALARNERNTIVIDHPNGKVGVVQTASRRVRRIVTYKSVGDQLSKGEWFGMIKFGSQVDLIIPASCKVNVILEEQVYAKKTLIAEW